MIAFARAHPVISYFVLTFSISWGGVLLVIGGPDARAGANAENSPLFPLAVLAMLAGPSLTSVVLTALLEGTRGLRALGSSLLDWRVAPRWYGVALLTAPVLALAATLALSLIWPEFTPALFLTDDKTSLVVLGLVVGLLAGVFEEIGWTGFAIPRLRQRHGVLVTGLLVGLLWSGWHVLVVAWGMGDRAGAIPVAVFILVDGLGGLPAFRVLMVWVYDRTRSLFVSVLMHLSLTACTLIAAPAVTGGRLLAYGVVIAAAFWLVIAAAARAGRGRLSRGPVTAGPQPESYMV